MTKIYERFDGAAVWRSLDPASQEELGAIALELVAAWWCQEQGSEPSADGLILRAGEAADVLLLEQLRQAFVDAVPRHALNDAEGLPRLPSRLGMVCRVCGCSQLDGCDVGCGWADTDLCTACTPAEAG